MNKLSILTNLFKTLKRPFSINLLRCELSIILIFAVVFSMLPAQPVKAATPSLDSISPNSGTSAGGTQVTITGSNFAPANQIKVLFGDVEAKVVSVNSEGTIITAVTPPYPSLGKVNVTVKNSDTETATLKEGFEYLQSKPTITGVAPLSGTSGTEITINGTQFMKDIDSQKKLLVKIGGILSTRVTFVSSTTIKAVVPLQTSGYKEIVVENPDGGVAVYYPEDDSQKFFYQKSTPTITSVDPTKGPINTATPITIKGTNFIAGNYPNTSTPITTVTIGGQPAVDVVVVNENTITAKTPSNISITGPQHVIVTVDGVNAIKENAFTFISKPVINSLNDIPAGVSPSQGSVLGGTVVTISGSGFMSGATVKFGGLAAQNVSVKSDSVITATTPPVSTPGSVAVTVTNPDGGAATLNNGFTYIQSTPSISSVSNTLTGPGPATSSILGGETIYIKGTGFGSDGYPGDVKVYIGGKLCSGITLTKTQDGDIISAVTPPGSVEGVATVEVVNKDGGRAVNNNEDPNTRFTYIRSKPAITGFSPSSSSTVRQDQIQIEGSDFMEGAKVYFGSLEAKNVAVSSDGTRITATIPEASAPGQVILKVVNPDQGTASAQNKFEYTRSAPVITSTVQGAVYAPVNTDIESLMNVRVNTGGTVGGTPIRIEGKDFSNSVQVTIGGKPATSVKVTKESPDRHIITALTPAGEVGEKQVVVTNPDGGSVTSTFKYVVSPTITGITPNYGSTEGGTDVIIDGTGFDDKCGVKVFFGGVEAAVKSLEPTRIVVTTPRNSEGFKDVTVINSVDYGLYTKKSGFEYRLPPSRPAIESISPTSGSTDGGTEITVKGTDIRSGAVLTIGGRAATVISIETIQEGGVYKSILVAKTPAGSAGEQEVRVTNPDGNYAVSPVPFTYKIPEKALSVTSITPDHGSVMGGTAVTINGANFVKETLISGSIYRKTKVTIGGNECGDVIVRDDLKTITATTPGGTVGAQDVIVKIVKVDKSFSPEKELEIESQAVLKGGYTYEIPQSSPRITSVRIYNPITDQEQDPVGPASGGSIVLIRGTGFMASAGGKTAEVYFGKNKAAIVEVVNAELIRTISPASTQVGAVDVKVVNPDGGEAVLPAGFIYKGNNLLVTSITPSSGTVLGNVYATVTGANFIEGTQVTIGGEAAFDVKVESSTRITLRTPPNTPGLKDVVVYNAYGSYTLKGAFLYYVEQSTPTIDPDGIIPNFGSAAGGDVITIKGSNFMSGPNFKVLIGGNPATNVVVKSPNEISARTPAGQPGWRDVMVINNDGGTATLPKGFLYKTNPVIQSVTPNKGPVSGGLFLSIKGMNFMPGADVRFVGDAVGGNQGLPLENVRIVSETEIKATAPAAVDGQQGYVDILVTNPDGGAGRLEAAFLYRATNTNPSIATITPNRGPVTGGTDITITGKDFAPDALVVIGGNFATDVRFVDNTTLTARTPAGQEGPADVQVINAQDGGFAVKPGGFTYMVPRSSPKITKVTPNRGSSEGGTPVTITGSDFREGLSVIIGGIEVNPGDVNLISPTEIRIITPRAKNYGKKDVTVVNQDGGAFTLKEGFEYVPPATLPSLAGVEPAEGSIFGGTLTRITGKNFVKGVKVYFGGVESAEVSVDDSGTLITAVTPEYKPGGSDIPVNGKYPVDVIVVNPDGGLAVWDGKFNYVVPDSRPKITSVSPSKGPASGGTYITIEGQDFRPNARVMIGTAEAVVKTIEDRDGNAVDGSGNQIQGTAFVAGVKITAVTPPAAPGKVDVRVINPDQGLAALKNGFEYLDVAGDIAIEYITPTEGAVSGGTPFTIKGRGFVNPVTVYFGGEEAKGATVIDPATITGRTPPNTQGKKDVVVLNGNGLSAALPGGFEYKVPDGYPKITQVDPAKGPAYGGIEVNIYGSNFKPGAVVYIGQNQAQVLSVDPARIRITLPEGTLGPCDVIVINPDTGLDILEEGFTYIDYPKIEKVTPDKGPVEGGTDITITGQLFHSGAAVLIGDKAATGVEVVNDTTIKARTPAGSPGYKDVTVINPDGGKAVLKNGFYYTPPRTRPGVPEDFSAGRYDKITIKLTWSTVLNANYYEIFGSKKSTGPFEYIDKTANTYYYVTDLVPGTKYYFKVRAVNELGTSDFSDTDSATTGSGREEKIVELPEGRLDSTTAGGAEIYITDIDALKDANYNIKLSPGGPRQLSKYTITISYDVIKDMKKSLTVTGEGFSLEFPASGLDVPAFKNLSGSDKDDASIRIAIEKADKSQKEYLFKFKERNMTPLTEPLNIKLEYRIKKETGDINYINARIELTPDYKGIESEKITSLSLCVFEPVERKWQPVGAGSVPYSGYYFMGSVTPQTYTTAWGTGAYINLPGWYAVFGN